MTVWAGRVQRHLHVVPPPGRWLIAAGQPPISDPYPCRCTPAGHDQWPHACWCNGRVDGGVSMSPYCCGRRAYLPPPRREKRGRRSA